MPGAQFWSAIFFLMLMVLGVSSAFALLDTLISQICDSEFGRRWNRSIVVSVVVVISFLISLIFCTEFGYYLLDGFDTWLNNFSLVWVVMCELLGATMVYRYKDVVGLLGWNAYLVWTASYLISLLLGVAIGHSVHPGAGAGVGFGIFFLGLGMAIALAHTPRHTTTGPPKLFAGNAILQKLYYLAFYQVSTPFLDIKKVANTPSRAANSPATSTSPSPPARIGPSLSSGVLCYATSQCPSSPSS
jgi:solute carrier family 6 GABA transporter-like protein 1